MKKILSFFGLAVSALIGSVSAATCADSQIGLPGTLALDIIPFAIFLVLVMWGLGHKSRKKAVHRTGFILILLEVLLAGVLPYLMDGQACVGLAWALFPLFMVIILSAFILHRTKKELKTRELLINAREKGYIRPDVILDEELAEKQREEAKAKKQVEKLRKKANAPRSLPPILSLKKSSKEEVKLPTPKKKAEEPKPAENEEKKSLQDLNVDSRFPMHGHLIEEKKVKKELKEAEVGAQENDLDGPMIEHELSSAKATRIDEDKETEDKHTVEAVNVDMPETVDKKAHAEMDKIINKFLGGEKATPKAKQKARPKDKKSTASKANPKTKKAKPAKKKAKAKAKKT